MAADLNTYRAKLIALTDRELAREFDGQTGEAEQARAIRQEIVIRWLARTPRSMAAESLPAQKSVLEADHG